ncbi:efflux RND transporter periplasmic adaptor subunit [Uliginosibacterium flavum]
MNHTMPKLLTSLRLPALLLSTLCLSTPALADDKAPTATAQIAHAGSEAGARPAPDLRKLPVIRPKIELWPDRVEVEGNVMPWQEVLVFAETGGLRLTSVQVNIGDFVRKGQVLAVLDTASVETELEAVNAQLIEAKATHSQAEATLGRAQRLLPSGGVSQQELAQYETQKQTAIAQLAVARTRVKAQERKLESAKLLAPDDGLISASTAAEGDIVRTASELFRLIRQARLEWRAEVPGKTLLRIEPGQEVVIASPLGEELKGRVRRVAPTIDIKTHTGLVYVDLPADSQLKAGLRVTGSLSTTRKALVLPAAAILHDKDGDRVFTLENNQVQAIKVSIGRTQDDKKEVIAAGLSERSRVVARDLEELLPENPKAEPAAQKPEAPAKS